MPERVEVPERTLENGMFGLKFSGAAFNLDYSLSYFKGFDDIPIQLDASDGLFTSPGMWQGLNCGLRSWETTLSISHTRPLAILGS
jgi:hypothetical protein